MGKNIPIIIGLKLSNELFVVLAALNKANLLIQMGNLQYEISLIIVMNSSKLVSLLKPLFRT